MTIAWVIDSLALGGTQKHLSQVVRGLSERRHKALVFCLNDIAHPIHLTALREAGAKVRVFGKARVASGLAPLIIAAAIRRERVDVVVNMLFVSTVVGRVAARLSSTPAITCLQARNLHYRAWQKLLLRMSAFLDAGTIGNSREALEFAAEYEGVALEYSHYVPNGIETPTPTPEPAPLDWTGLGWPQLCGKKVIGSVGRLVWQKGYDVLIDAFAPLAAENTDLSLLLIGKGPESQALASQAAAIGLEGRVVFAGERTDVPSILRGLTLYVQPSRFEGMPNALMEAMATGVPVVASSVDDIIQLITTGIDGHLVPPDDKMALTISMRETLDGLCSDDQGRLQARESITIRFPLDVMISGYENVLQSYAK